MGMVGAAACTGPCERAGKLQTQSLRGDSEPTERKQSARGRGRRRAGDGFQGERVTAPADTDSLGSACVLTSSLDPCIWDQVLAGLGRQAREAAQEKEALLLGRPIKKAFPLLPARRGEGRPRDHAARSGAQDDGWARRGAGCAGHRDGAHESAHSYLEGMCREKESKVERVQAQSSSDSPLFSLHSSTFLVPSQSGGARTHQHTRLYIAPPPCTPPPPVPSPGWPAPPPARAGRRPSAHAGLLAPCTCRLLRPRPRARGQR